MAGGGEGEVGGDFGEVIFFGETTEYTEDTELFFSVKGGVRFRSGGGWVCRNFF